MVEMIIILVAIAAINIGFEIIKRKAERPVEQVEETAWPPVERKKVG